MIDIIKSVSYSRGKVIGKAGDYIIIKVKALKETYIGDPAMVTLGKFKNEEQREWWDKEIESDATDL